MKRLEKYKSIRSARKAFLDGITVYAIPCKLNPYYLDGVFLIRLNKFDLIENKWDTTAEKCFDSAISEIMYYNCDSERGLYLHFYTDLYDLI